MFWNLHVVFNAGSFSGREWGNIWVPPRKETFFPDTLSHLDIDELNSPHEETLKLISEWEPCNIEFPMGIPLICKVQIQVPGLRDKGSSQSYYAMQHTEGYELLCHKNKSTFLIHKEREWYPGIMNVHPC
jgi:hypothetical protein